MTDFPPLASNEPFEPINMEMTDVEVLHHTRAVKLRLLGVLSKDIPNDPKDVRCLLDVMDSLDKVALHNIKNSIQQDSNDAIHEANAIMRRIQAQVGNTDPYMVDVTPTQMEERVVTIDQELVALDPVPGEMSQELRDLRYDAFVTEMEETSK